MRRALLFLCFVTVAGCGDDDATAHGSGPPAGPPEGLTAAEWGEQVFRSRGCVACHSIDGKRVVGGPVDGLWGSERPLATGETVVADEAYVRESILNPTAKVVRGYVPQMPRYRGILADAEVDALVAYLQALQ